MENGGAAKLQEYLLVGQDKEDSRFKIINDRLEVKVHIEIHMIFSLQVSCIIKTVLLIWHKSEKQYSGEENKNLNERRQCEVYVMKGFFELFRKKTLIDRNAYLMTELIQDIDKVSLEVSVFKKKCLSKSLEILLDFLVPAKNRLITAVKLIHVNTLWLY